MDNIPKETLNCKLNMPRLESLEKGMSELTEATKKFDCKIEDITKQNNVQNETLAEVRTIVKFIVENKKEQRNVERDREIRRNDKDVQQNKLNDKFVTALNDISKSQVEIVKNVEATNTGLDTVKTELKEVKDKQETIDNKGNINIIDMITDNTKSIIKILLTGGILYILAQIVPNLIK